MTTIRPVRVKVPQAALADLRRRLENTRWPQSFPAMGWDHGTNTEYMRELADYLTDPVTHGGKAADSFTLIIPSLCGFCLSDQVPRRAFGFQDHPAVYRAILHELGDKRYGIQGGDWGGIITFPWGHQFPEDLTGVHLNLKDAKCRVQIDK